MAESTVIKEFLVALGYKVDESSAKKFVGGIASMTKAVMHLGVRVEATALAVAYGVARFASNLEALYFAAQRTSSSADQLQALSLAAQNFGASADDALGSVEALAAFMRNNAPGAGEGLIEGWLGIYGLSAKGVTSDEKRLAIIGQMFAIEKQRGLWSLANQQAMQLGISDKMALAMAQPGFANELASDERRTKGWQGTAEAAHRFEIQLRNLKLQLEQLFLPFMNQAMPALQGAMTQLSRFMKDHGKQLATDLGDAFTFVIKGLGDLLDWLDRNGKEMIVRLEALWLELDLSFTLNVKPIFEWLYTQFIKLDEITGGWSTKILAVVTALKLLGATGLVTGLLGLGTGLAKAAVQVGGGVLGLAVNAGPGVWATAGAAFGLAAWAALGVGLGAMLDHFFPNNPLAKFGSWTGEKIHDFIEDFNAREDENAAYFAGKRSLDYYRNLPNHAALDAQYSPHFEINVSTVVHGGLGGNPYSTAGYVASETERKVRQAAADLTREWLATVR